MSEFTGHNGSIVFNSNNKKLFIRQNFLTLSKVCFTFGKINLTYESSMKCFILLSNFINHAIFHSAVQKI